MTDTQAKTLIDRHFSFIGQMYLHFFILFYVLCVWIVLCSVLPIVGFFEMVIVFYLVWRKKHNV